jgi:hypothetical protein
MKYKWEIVVFCLAVWSSFQSYCNKWTSNPITLYDIYIFLLLLILCHSIDQKMANNSVTQWLGYKMATGESGFDSQQGQRFYLCTTFVPALYPTQPNPLDRFHGFSYSEWSWLLTHIHSPIPFHGVVCNLSQRWLCWPWKLETAPAGYTLRSSGSVCITVYLRRSH